MSKPITTRAGARRVVDFGGARRDRLIVERPQRDTLIVAQIRRDVHALLDQVSHR